MKGTLSFYECGFSGGDAMMCGDIQTLPCAKEFLNFLHSQATKTPGGISMPIFCIEE